VCEQVPSDIQFADITSKVVCCIISSRCLLELDVISFSFPHFAMDTDGQESNQNESRSKESAEVGKALDSLADRVRFSTLGLQNMHVGSSHGHCPCKETTLEHQPIIR
jgi:hypothetical protein